MNRSAHNLIAATLATLTLTCAAETYAHSDGAAFDQVPQCHCAGAQHQWVNALVPRASGDFEAAAEGTSADDAFMRQVAYYTRDMLDRGGWVNAYVDDSHYASGNALLTVRVGDGVTTRIPA